MENETTELPEIGTVGAWVIVGDVKISPAEAWRIGQADRPIRQAGRGQKREGGLGGAAQGR